MRGINTAANFKFSLWLLRQFLIIGNNEKKINARNFIFSGFHTKQWDRKINQPRKIRNIQYSTESLYEKNFEIFTRLDQIQQATDKTLKYHWKKQLAMFYCMTMFYWQCFTYSVLLIMFYLGSLYLEPDSLVTWWRRIKGTKLSIVIDLVERGHVTGKKRQDLVTRGHLILKSDRKIHSIFFYLC